MSPKIIKNPKTKKFNGLSLKIYVTLLWKQEERECPIHNGTLALTLYLIKKYDTVVFVVFKVLIFQRSLLFLMQEIQITFIEKP